MAYLGKFKSTGFKEDDVTREKREAITKKKKSSKKTVVIGVTKTKSGLIKEQVDVGRDLTEEQRRQVSAAREEGALTTTRTAEEVVFTRTARPTPEQTTGRVLATQTTPRETVITQAPPGVIPTSTPGQKQTIQQQNNIQFSFLQEEMPEKPYFGTAVQPLPTPAQRVGDVELRPGFTLRQAKQRAKETVPGQVVFQTVGLGRDLVVGTGAAIQEDPAALATTIFQRDKEQSFVGQFRTERKALAKKYRREKTVLGVTVASAGVAIGAAPALTLVGVPATTAQSVVVGGGIAADIGVTGFLGARAAITRRPEDVASAIIAGGLGAASTGLSLRGQKIRRGAGRIRERIRSSKDKDLILYNDIRIDPEIRDDLTFTGRPVRGVVFKSELTGTSAGEFGKGVALPIYGDEVKGLRFEDIKPPSKIIEQRRFKAEYSPLYPGDTPGLVPTRRTVVEARTQGVIQSRYAISEPTPFYRLSGEQSRVPFTVETEGTIRYSRLRPADTKTRKYFEANKEAIQRRVVYRDYERKRIGYQPKIGYDPEGVYQRIGKVNIEVNGQSREVVVTETGNIIGVLEEKPPFYVITDVKSAPVASPTAGRIISASEVIKRTSQGEGATLAASSDSGVTTVLVTPETVSQTVTAPTLNQMYQYLYDPLTGKARYGQKKAVAPGKQRQKTFEQQLQEAGAKRFDEDVVFSFKKETAKTKAATIGESKNAKAIAASTLAYKKKYKTATKKKYAYAKDYAYAKKYAYAYKYATAVKPAVYSGSRGDTIVRNVQDFSLVRSIDTLRPRTDVQARTLPKFKLFKKQRPLGFGVFVRQRGEFRAFGRTRTAREAFIKGERLTGSRAAASFKVVELRTGRVAQPTSLGKDFYKSAREEGVIVEKRERRIKSRGELKEITFKGVQAQRKRFKL